MQKSTIYDALSISVVEKWRNSEETDDYFHKVEKEKLEELKTTLNEESLDLLNSYSLAIENKMDYLYYNLNIRFLNLGIKIGMELEKAFLEHEDQ